MREFPFKHLLPILYNSDNTHFMILQKKKKKKLMTPETHYILKLCSQTIRDRK